MSNAYIDCMVYHTRIIVPGSDAMDDAEVTAWLVDQGCTVRPTHYAEHAHDAGQALVLAGLESRDACVLEHDPEPYLRYAGTAVGGGAGVTFNAGGPRSGRKTLSPRDEFCQEPSHYWAYDRFTVPAMAVAFEANRRAEHLSRLQSQMRDALDVLHTSPAG